MYGWLLLQKRRLRIIGVKWNIERKNSDIFKWTCNFIAPEFFARKKARYQQHNDNATTRKRFMSDADKAPTVDDVGHNSIPST